MVDSSPHLPATAGTLTQATTTLDAEALYRQYARYVAAIGLRLLGRDDEVDDLVQDVFLAVHRQRGHHVEPDAVRGWLATVTVRTATRKLRRRQLKRLVGLDAVGDYEQLVSRDASPEQRALLARVYQALDELPPRLRVPWTLRHVEGFKLAEIADACDTSLATIKRRIATAGNALQQRLGTS